MSIAINTTNPLFPRDVQHCIQLVLGCLRPVLSAKQKEAAHEMVAKILLMLYDVSPSNPRAHIPQQNAVLTMTRKQLHHLVDGTKKITISPAWYLFPPPPFDGVDTSAPSLTLTWRVTDDKDRNKNLVDFILMLPPKAETLYGKK